VMKARAASPDVLVDLADLDELRTISFSADQSSLEIGAMVTNTQLIASSEVEVARPILAEVAATIADVQIRNRGTIGGNLGTSSPAGDALPPLLVEDAEVECMSVRGMRRIPLGEFVTGVKRNVLEPDELITAVWLTPSNAPQTFMKIGPRNAMVIAVVSLAVSAGDELRASFGSASPRPVLVTAPRDEADSFAERVAAAASPIDDVRGTESYRRHALQVLTTRALKRVLA